MIITVRTQIEGIHFWENAPEEVAFLRFLHRHLFKVSLTLPVTHDDRQLEFFMVKTKLDALLFRLSDQYHDNMPFLRNFGPCSCEKIANAIVGWAHPTFKVKGTIEATVQEDDENSSTVKRTF